VSWFTYYHILYYYNTARELGGMKTINVDWDYEEGNWFNLQVNLFCNFLSLQFALFTRKLQFNCVYQLLKPLTIQKKPARTPLGPLKHPKGPQLPHSLDARGQLLGSPLSIYSCKFVLSSFPLNFFTARYRPCPGGLCVHPSIVSLCDRL